MLYIWWLVELGAVAMAAEIVCSILLGVMVATGAASEVKQTSRDSSTGKVLPRRMELREGWTLGCAQLVREGGEAVSKDGFDCTGWHATMVPSTVLNALIKNGVYPDFRVGLNSLRMPDSSDEFNARHDLAKYSHLPGRENPWRQPWWYRTEFELPDIAEGIRTWLHFDAINYCADVWVNGRQIADRRQMAGMFRRFAYDITGCARKGRNVLAVKIYPVDHPGDPDTQTEVFGQPRGYFKEIMRDVTEIMTVGYDCMPTVPDRNMGIWQDVHIELTGAVDIRNPFVVTDLPLPKTDRAELKISAELVNGTSAMQKGILRGAIAGTGLSFEQPVEVAPGQTKTVSFDPPPAFSEPRLWWPVNYGPQNLYDVRLGFYIDGRVSDEEVVRFGVREVGKELYKLDGAHGMRLHINGQKIFCRGGYIQPEVMFDWDAERMETEIRYFTQANLNLVYFEDIPNPPAGFLEACDKYGLLFGNCFYSCYWLRPGTNYPDDLDLLEQCTIDIVKRYRNHPCIWLYMAMNEQDTRQVVYEMWRRHIIALDGTRLWIPSAYFPDDRKDAPEWFKEDLPTGMTDIGATYTWKEPKAYYDFVRNDRRWMFMMESGSASLPPIESLSRFIPDLGQESKPDVFPLNKTWAHHGANSYYKDYDQALRRIYGRPESVADYCMKGHLITADQHRAMFEAVNHRMWDITSGFTQWKINACWPSVQWQIFDWYLKPMVSYYYIKKACEPLHIQLGLLEPTVTIVNNHPRPQTNLLAWARLYDFGMRLLFEKEAKTDVEANSYKDIFTIERHENLTDVYFVKLELSSQDGKVLSDNFYWLSSGDLENLGELKKLPLVDLKTSYKTENRGKERIVRVKVENPTDKLAFFVHLAVTNGRRGDEILPVFWDDNYFSLLPHESREVCASFASKDLRGKAPAVEVGGWNIRSDYECAKLEVSKEKVKINDPFTVTGEVKDTFIDGSPVELRIDGATVDCKRLYARIGNQQVIFIVKLDKPGRHEIKIGSQSTSVLAED